MSPQDMANCAYGLSIMSFDIENPSDVSFRGAHESLMSMIKTSGRVLLPMMMMVNDNNNNDDGENDDNEVITTSSVSDARIKASSSNSSSSSSSSSSSRSKNNALLSREEIEQLRIFAHYAKVLIYFY